MKPILFWTFFASQASWADCMYLPNKRCIQLRVVEIVQKGKDQICVTTAEQKGPAGSKSETWNVFFRTCPKPGTRLDGDLIQRSDITLEGIAACQYEFTPNKNCKSPAKP